MALTLRNIQLDALAIEVAARTGESKTQAVRKALLERRERIHLLKGSTRKRDVGKFLATHIWPSIPPGMPGQELTRSEHEQLNRDLGIDLEGA
jgi:antitoxin VapB